MRSSDFEQKTKIFIRFQKIDIFQKLSIFYI